MTVNEYVNSYDFRGDSADHIPTEDERAMLEDAIEGYLALAVTPPEVDPIQAAIDADNGGRP